MKAFVFSMFLGLLLPGADQDKKGEDKKQEDKNKSWKDDPLKPKPGVLPETLEIDWTCAGELEALISGLDTVGYWKPHPKRKHIKISSITWGKRIQVEYDREVLYPANGINAESERDYYYKFYREYDALHERIFTEARAKILKYDLLPRVKDLEDKKGRWISKYLRKYRPGKPVRLSRKATLEDVERAHMIRELSVILNAVREHKPLVDAALRRSKLQVRLELARRKKAMDKWLKRYDVRPLAYAKTYGSSVANVHLDSSIIKPVKEYINRQRVYPVLTEKGERIWIGKDRTLFLSDDFGAREVFDFLREVTHEHFIARYMEKKDDGYEDVLKAVGFRLLKDRYWFLIYNNRVVIMPERGLPKRRK